VLNVMVRDPSDFINETTLVYLRDIYDHVVQTIDLIENYREFGSNPTDYYLSIVSNRMNEVMKVLTIIATIFIPLTFIAGIYGMNFDGTACHPGTCPSCGRTGATRSHWERWYCSAWARSYTSGTRVGSALPLVRAVMRHLARKTSRAAVA
jgi:ribosomal protein L37AE/L43A